MKPEDLKQCPPNSTATPFSCEKRPAEEALPESFGAKRQKLAAPVEADTELPEKVVAALLSGDHAAYDKLKGGLEGAVTACGCATKPKEHVPKPAAVVDAPSSMTELLASHNLPPIRPFEPEPEKELTPAERMRKECADDFLKKAPAKGVVRYNFDQNGPLGIRLSRDVPPWILEVRDGTLAAKKAPRVPVGGVVAAVNGYELSEADNSGAIAGLAKRPVILDIEWPTDQGAPIVNRA